MSSPSDFYALVTGANSGVGFSLAQRLCHDFLVSRPSSARMTLIFTTRTSSKGNETTAKLVKYLGLLDQKGVNATPRVTLKNVQMDLSILSTVAAAAKGLHEWLPQLDVIVLNAGMGAFTGIDWGQAVLDFLKSPIQASTCPGYKMQEVGRVAKQGPGGEELGAVFCANVFGHYYLLHELMALLKAGDEGGRAGGRAVWISSLEAYGWTFDVLDIQGIKATHSYEASKRLTDVLALSSGLVETSPFTSSYYNAEHGEKPRVKMLLAHPGICATSIMGLPLVLWYCMAFTFYVVRWLGSKWHCMDCWTGAAAPCKLALASDGELEQMDAINIKWGSGTDFWGREILRITEVECTEDEEWQVLARETWRQIEELRKEWKRKIDHE